MRARLRSVSGLFLRASASVSGRSCEPSRHSVLRMLALIARDASLAELEDELKSCPTFVLQLLRLVNSGACGLGRRIGSLREAVLAVGTRQIARWAQLLLYASRDSLPWRSDPLVQLAGTRSRFMELLASCLRPADGRFVDAAFMTGIFSLVHVLLGDAAPDDALARLGLMPEIGDAITRGKGLLGAMLAVAKAAEAGGAEAAVARQRRCIANSPRSRQHCWPNSISRQQPGSRRKRRSVTEKMARRVNLCDCVRQHERTVSTRRFCRASLCEMRSMR